MNKITVLLLGMVLALTTLSVPAPASAMTVQGCDGRVQQRADNWANNVVYYIPSPSRIPRYDMMRVTATTAYFYCPNGKRPTKIKPTWTSYCYSHLQGGDGAAAFGGVKFDGVFFDDNTTVAPAAIKVNDDGTVQNCETKYIDFDTQKWLHMPDSPGWTVSSWVIRAAWPDHEHTFQSNDHPYKFFNPGNDVVLIDWF